MTEIEREGARGQLGTNAVTQARGDDQKAREAAAVVARSPCGLNVVLRWIGHDV